MTRIRGISEIVAAAVIVGALCGSLPALGQTAPATPPADPVKPPANPWTFRVTPYAWLTWMSGSQTVKGRTVDTNTNVFQLLGQSQSLIPFMGYFEARYQDRISLFVDVMYANLTAGESSILSSAGKARLITACCSYSSSFLPIVFCRNITR